MRAGVLDYRLCDRGFDCQGCPLDAALRGKPWCWNGAGLPAGDPAGFPVFPADRLYSPGHTWLAPAGGSDRLFRLGLDRFACALLGVPLAIRLGSQERSVRAGEAVFELELEEGAIPIGAAVPGQVRRCNEGLSTCVSSLVRAPYGDGWVAELEAQSAEAVGNLLHGAEAARRAMLDARRFWRGVALHLLAEPSRVEQLTPEKLRTLTDLRGMLGGAAYLALVRDLIY
jgi:glycine cleavage system H protein